MAVEQVAVEVASMAKLGAGIAIGFFGYCNKRFIRRCIKTA